MMRLLLILLLAGSAMAQVVITGPTTLQSIKISGSAANLSHDMEIIGEATIPPTNGMIAHWKLGELAGTRVDEIGNNDLEPTQMITNDVGQHVLGVATVGGVGSGYLSIADNADLSFGNEAFTITGWWFPTNVTPVQSVLVAKTDYPNTVEYMVYESSATIWFHVGAGAWNGGGFVGTTATNAFNTWHFFAAWHDPATDVIAIQVDNGPIYTTAFGSGATDGGGTFAIGRMPQISNNGAARRMDTISIWGRLLTDAERRYLWNYGGGREYPFSPP
jgi:hypothetical protein